MKRREIVLALIGAALLYFSGGKLIHRSPLDRKQITIGETCRTPATIFQLRDRKPQSTVVVFHGLSANRHVMYYLGEEFAQAGARVYLLDFPGHGDSTESFTFAHAEQCASEAIGTLIRNGEVDPDKTAFIGHSMGGAIAIRLADQFPTAATIAISPAPLVLPHRIPSNLLVFTAQFDIPILKGAARQIARAAQGNRTEDSDFWERRAFELKRVAYATHSSLIVDWRVTDKSLEWIKRSFAREHIETIAPGDRAFPLHGMIDSDVGGQTQGGALIGLLGLLMIFPLAATAIAATFRQTGAGTPATSPSMPTSSELLSHSATNKILLQWAVAAFIAVCIMTIAVPLHPILRQFSGDYLASLLLLSSALLWMLNWKQFKQASSFDPRSFAAALVLGFATFLAIGAWLNLQLTDAWMNWPRWWRFALMLPLLLPYFFAEESALGSLQGSRTASAKRFGFFLALRSILWLACGFAFLVTRNDQTIIIILLTIPLALFSGLQRLGADALLRRTSSIPATAVFDAILAAWFLAAVFPLT